AAARTAAAGPKRWRCPRVSCATAYRNMRPEWLTRDQPFSGHGQTRPTGRPLFLRGDLAGRGHHRIGDRAGIAADRLFDQVADLGMVLQMQLGVFAPLADPLAVIGEPRARFLDDPGLHSEIDQLA